MSSPGEVRQLGEREAVEIRNEVSRILASSAFAGSPRLGEFLRFVVEETIAGRSRELKEYSIGIVVYRRDPGYRTSDDPTVRVEAARLRGKLHSYYQSEGRNDLWLIAIPKGGYTPSWERRSAVPGVEVPEHLPRRWIWILGSATLVAVSAIVGSLASHRISRPNRVLLPITNYPGIQNHPQISPDGSRIAFTWDGGNSKHPAVYVKEIASGEPRLLTSSPLRHTGPAWSPDGQMIAFVRDPGNHGEVYTIPATGGVEQKVLDGQGGNVAWTPDGKSLVVADRPNASEPFRLFVFDPLSGAKRQITFPITGLGDRFHSVSPNGRWVAFSRWLSGTSVMGIFIVPLAGGDARRIVAESGVMPFLCWTPDSQEVVYASRRAGVTQLWRIRSDLAPGNRPHPIPETEDGTWPSIAGPAPGPWRLAFLRNVPDLAVVRIDLSAPSATPVTLVESAREENNPQYSPDGRFLLFVSDRLGTRELWVARADGAELRKITNLNAEVDIARWSPDSRWIAFDAAQEGNRDIYVVQADGSSLRRLTSEQSEDARPSWSRDGAWVYFRSDRSGKEQIWKMFTAEWGAPVQVTRGGGFDAMESWDGQFLVVKQARFRSPIYMMPVSGGESTSLVDESWSGYWVVGIKGLYYLALPREWMFGQPQPLRLVDLRTREQTELISRTQVLDQEGALSLSPDSRYAVWTVVAGVRSEIMRIDGFR
jgi:Tol biopolymer transport system component